jgi:hypothetical protein
MRRAALAVLVLVLVGCGESHSTQAKPAKEATPVHRYAAGRIAIAPAERDGFWRKLELSPDLRWWLGQWSGECEAQSTYLIPARGGKARAILPGGESYALGWRGRWAKIMLPRALCGGNGDLKAGIYLVDPQTLKLTLVRRIKARPGGP